MTVEKPKPKQLLRPITTGADSATNQSQFLEITCNTLKAREKSRLHGAIGFGFASHWLKNWRESFKPITKRSNRNYIITFDSHLKTALDSSYQNFHTLSPLSPRDPLLPTLPVLPWTKKKKRLMTYLQSNNKRTNYIKVLKMCIPYFRSFWSWHSWWALCSTYTLQN